MTHPRATMKLFKTGDSANMVVWIGKGGCAVLPNVSEPALPVSPTMAQHFIRKHRLAEVERRRDGIVYHQHDSLPPAYATGGAS